MTSTGDLDDGALPEPGPPFQIGDRVAFFPAEVGPTSMWMTWDFAVIDDINEGAQSLHFHFVNEPEARHGQGFENIVRRTPNYGAWRAAWEDAFARTQSERIADLETEALSRRVLAEHPIHGRRLDRSPSPPTARGGWRQRYGFTRREYVVWALVVGVPALLLVAGIIAILIYEGPVA